MLRSLLFIPGNNPAMLQNADVHNADAVILDLEDAVSPLEKDAARILVFNAIKYLGFNKDKIVVRINPLNTDYAKQDIDTIVPLMPKYIMPSKVSSADYIKSVSALIKEAEIKNGIKENTVKIIALIETAEGIENAYPIAKADERVEALFLGAEDLTSDMQALRTKEGFEIAYARGRIVTAARSAGIEAIDTPFTDVHDDEGLIKDASLARNMGFTGKASISPHHVSGINKAFSPSAEEIDYAKAVMEAIEEGKRLGRGAVSLKGKMIDRPIVLRAEKVLNEARELGLLQGEY
ncbi:MAG: HpcH/HpaI aldolase/citrate lyase family protein [Christensenellales bacterium]|jgi:citrate lyase subunit beta/citryl-CoA lyase